MKFLNKSIYSWIAVCLVVFATSTQAEEIEIEIQVVDFDATPEDVVNTIEMPSFLGKGSENSKAADSKGKASEFNPTITGQLPGNQGRGEAAREAARQKANSHRPDNKPSVTPTPSTPGSNGNPQGSKP